MLRLRCEHLKECTVNSSVKLERAEENHLFKVMRAKPGNEIELLDGKGERGIAVIGREREIILRSRHTESFPGRRIHLYIAPPRRQKMDQLLHAAAELGVYRIVPVLCEYSVAEPDADSVERWNMVMFESCKQSGNVYLPQIETPVPFEKAIVDSAEKCDLVFTGSPYADKTDLQNLPGEIGFFVGPEGGFSAQETAAMEKAGFRFLRIGPWILRVETAAIAGIACLR